MKNIANFSNAAKAARPLAKVQSKDGPPMTPKTDKEKTPEKVKEDSGDEMVMSPLTIGSVT